jgi:hypothetical protein
VSPFDSRHGPTDEDDRVDDYTPAPDAPPLTPEQRAFRDAFARGCAIYAAGDNPRALAAAVGTTQVELIKRAAGLQLDAARSYAEQGLSPEAMALCAVTDALLLGILVGRELSR